MSFQTLVQSAQSYYPNLKIKYKDESLLMKTIGKIMFFNKSFMTSFTTTLGSTIYYPNSNFVKARPISSSVILLHELVHVHDANKFTMPLFSFLYACPQILVLLFFPLLFVNWYVALGALLFAAPLPAYFRMYFEKRAYFTSLYALNKLGKKLNFDPALDRQKADFVNQFKSSSYYWMWPFGNLDKQFEDAMVKIRNDERPFNDSVFDILDDLVKAA
jgi:hypothetical protein